MIPEIKIIEFLLGIGVFIFILLNYSKLRSNPNLKIIVFAFYSLLLTNVLGILEELFWGEFLNIIQHIFLAISALLLFIWFYKVFIKKEKDNEHRKYH